MTDRIKLTEDNFDVINYYHENDGKIKVSKELQQQILEEQSIVDELIKCYRECRARQENLAISQFETDQQLFMEKLYKRATSKDIKAILEEK